MKGVKMKIVLLVVLTIPCNVLSQGLGVKIDSICKKFLKESGITGFSVAITKDNNLLLANGYGYANREKDKLATESTIYPVASVSKLVTAAAIMKLVDKDILQLDDRVMDILPNFPKRQYLEEITIDHVLRHTSGIVDYGKWADSVFLNGGTVTDKDFINFIDRPLLFRAGTSFSYSNSGFKVLTMVIEKLSRLPFDDFIRKEIAVPANMPSLAVWSNNLNHQEATTNYERHNDSIQVGNLMDIPIYSGDGGLSASVLDLIKLPRLLIKETLISPALLEKMLSPTALGDIQMDYGMGVRLGEVVGHKIWGHTGGGGGSTIAKLVYFPEYNISMAILVNTLYTSKGVLDLEEAILPVLLQLKKPKTKETVDAIHYTDAFVTKDRWGGNQASVRVISERNRQLFRDNPYTKTPAQQLFYLGEDTFRNDFYPFDHFKFHFVDGNVAACSEYANGMFIQLRFKEK